MPRYDFKSPRLFVDVPLREDVDIVLPPQAAHYLSTVLRLRPGDSVLVFNGRDGEWSATLSTAGKRSVQLRADVQTRAQEAAADLHYLFAPLKQARLDYMVQKAVEMGVARLVPVLTQHGQVARLNAERMRANAIEAAEQCGILTVPEVDEPLRLADAVARLGAERTLVFCDEEADVRDPVAALATARRAGMQPLAVVVGPEGGFAPAERDALLKAPGVVRLALGPRILRADTAAVAALALAQAVLGDWRVS
ncbi:MAG: 16S rRNA (uracil(1498)-N(3))-methyltransferase [Rhizobiales bacterium]|nr:16S rRNA (uracil(1498)-N(3))-methyltransferase [Hyphomicrobiales bacterium]